MFTFPSSIFTPLLSRFHSFLSFLLGVNHDADETRLLEEKNSDTPTSVNFQIALRG